MVQGCVTFYPPSVSLDGGTTEVMSSDTSWSCPCSEDFQTLYSLGVSRFLLSCQLLVIHWHAKHGNFIRRKMQCIRKVFRPLDFFHIVLLYSLILKCIKLFPPHFNLHTIPHNDKERTGFRNVCKFRVVKNGLQCRYSGLIKNEYTPDQA